MTKLIKIKHPKQGQTYKSLALRMVNGAIHRSSNGAIVRFRLQREAVKYARVNFSPRLQPTITVLH